MRERPGGPFLCDIEAAIADVFAERAHTDRRTDAEEATLLAEVRVGRARSARRRTRFCDCRG
jgi:hypothetical protein